MECLFVVNKNLSSRTARFWKKNQPIIEHHFPDSQYYFPKSLSGSIDVDVKKNEIIVFIGDDGFFSQITNQFYDLLTDNFGRNILAFMPDSNHSSLVYGLGIPCKTGECIDLIKSKHTIPLDIIRCHYVDTHGFPASHLILNDAVIGLPVLKAPVIVKNVVKWLRRTIRLSNANSLKRITLINDNKVVYEGTYSFAAILLGRKITRGLKLRSKRIRMNLTRFEYVQLNTQLISEFPSFIPELISGNLDQSDKHLLVKKFSEVEMKGFGEENRITADGLYLGRLPATFTLLPKAFRVISPVVVKRVKKPWHSSITAKVPNPIINRENPTFRLFEQSPKDIPRV